MKTFGEYHAFALASKLYKFLGSAGQNWDNYAIAMQIGLRLLNLFAFAISENYSCAHKLQMTVAKNDNQEQGNISETNARLQEILALAKEIEHLTKHKKTNRQDS